jgi:hypothetical protein
MNLRFKLVISVGLLLALSACLKQNTTAPTSSLDNQASSQSQASPTLQEEPVVVIKKVEQLSDVKPEEQVYQSLENLINRYGIAIAYGDATFRGDRILTRYELVMTINSTADKATEIAGFAVAPYATSKQSRTVNQLVEEIATELADLRNSIAQIEAEQRSDQASLNCFASASIHPELTLKPASLQQLSTRNQHRSLARNVAQAIPSAYPASNSSASLLAQVTSMSQLQDVRPTDWAYQAVQSLVERYGIGELIYPDSTFRGNQGLTRDRFAIVLNQALERVIELNQIVYSDSATKAEMQVFINSLDDLLAELWSVQDWFDEIIAKGLSKSTPAKFAANQRLQFHPLPSIYPSCYSPAPFLNAGFSSTTRSAQPVRFPLQPAPQDFRIAQVTSVKQMKDVPDNHWAYEAIKSMVELYGALPSYPDGTFRGNQPTTNYQYAAALNAILDRIAELIAAAADTTKKDEMEKQQRLYNELVAELDSQKRRITALVNTSEATNFR